ncbi:uncharacterized protein LOC133393317 [Anopheles gambiae]|uniref:uncharacterized protein LOC125906413 n=1 Tax=Anopheles coluzzii TaxID=1518534 RepID=UPI0020FF8F0D|nr:uncharacterized protein LOC125906413 [Anopheles coluzzii]XP_049461047.1 uncharacterized protein LOC125906413 [Anopheles coluzzii]XP_049461048.1 uncharacterized protein LOC125906414 [Anopheles coluzzii]XP_049463841.1 uncharacterized protein LOC120960870 [Anopheles coluzzii]XP_049463842.1 uncharacterized protein LOC120960870 [Anopheles coluzzii]XP_049463843.1 uncharacterized protein LOC125906914 [Anopheles coluzzii]XP_049463844.1 uncharacterized protein LOC125906914 [Anopheles coluzzii]XP_0
MEPNTSAATRRVVKTTSDSDRKRVITAYENGSAPSAISQMLNIKRPTVYGIINKYNATWQIAAAKRGGTCKKKLSQDAVESIRAWIDEDCAITLKSLAQKVFERHGVHVSISTIAREVKGFNYSFKMLQKIPERRNTTATIEERTTYARNFYQITRAFPVSGLIYLDEVGFNVSMRTSKGRSQKGTPAVTVVPQIRTRNISIVCAMNSNGIVHYVTHNQPVNRELFTNFIYELKDILRSKNINRSYLIMDNVAFHKSQSVQEAIGTVIDKPLYLPPYSPFLNPIENMFSKWKNYVKRSNCTNHDQLMEAICNGANYVTAEDCEGFINNMWNYMSRCLSGEEILD